MTIIIHGPQGCGKTFHGEALRAFFKLTRVLEDHEPPLGNGGIWHLMANAKYHAQVKALDALVLTSERPPKALQLGDEASRRILTFAQAMKQAGLKSTLPKPATAPAAKATKTKKKGA